MKALDLARRWALLGAESSSRTPEHEVADAHEGFSVQRERWHALRAELVQVPAEDWLEQLGATQLSGWLVRLAAACELYPDAAAAVSILAEDPGVRVPTASVFARLARAADLATYVEALLEGLPRGAALESGVLRYGEARGASPLSEQPLRIGREALGALLGGPAFEGPWGLDAVELAAPKAPCLEGVWQGHELPARIGTLVLRARVPSTARQAALDVAARTRQPLVLVQGGATPPDPERFAHLRRDLVALDLFEACEGRSPDMAYLRALGGALEHLLLLLPEGAEIAELPAVDVPPLTLADRRRVFEVATDLEAEDVESIARSFAVSVEEVRRATGGRRGVSKARIEDALRDQGARRMGRAVSRLISGAKRAQLVVPEPLGRMLDDIRDWHRVSASVYEEDYMGDAPTLGRGLTCLFSGPSGTGKTFAAQCLANELGLNLYRIDLSQVVSKYIGETEKALARIFDEAEAGHGVLLFDEADALFGKRSEVSDAHDRYANIEVAYLLQRMEAFGGTSILTTNLRDNMDAAFLRRIRFLVDFPMPDVEMRAKLWTQALPAKKHHGEDIDLGVYAERFALTGGNIHSVGLAAAHLACAEPDRRLMNRHLVKATLRELEKSGLPRSRALFGPLERHLPREAGA